MTDYYTRYASYFPLEKTAILSNTIEISDVASEEYEIQKFKSKFGLNCKKRLLDLLVVFQSKKGWFRLFRSLLNINKILRIASFYWLGQVNKNKKLMI